MAKSLARVDRKLTLLRKADIFSTLQEKDLSLLARLSGWCSFAPGDTVFSAGSHVEELSLIEEGTVVIRKNGDNGAEQDIARFIAGEVFGELDLLDTAPRSASAIAETAATLLVFPSRGVLFRHIIEEHPAAFARILQHLLGVISGRIRAANRLVSEKTPWVQELRRQLLRDKLTGLYNRAFLDEELAGLLHGAPGTSLLVLKPDAFKTINDSFGHEAGDRTLVAIADTLKLLLSEGDAGVRYRGDEFCIVLPGRDAAAARAAAEAAREAVRCMDLRPIIGDRQLAFTASVGVAAHPPGASGHPSGVAEARALVTLAHQRMMEARSAGGDRVEAGERA